MITTDEKLDKSIEEIMTKQVHTVSAGMKMIDVRQNMAKWHVRHIPVLEKKKLVGIISLTDIQRMSFSNTYGDDEMSIDDTISDLFTAGMVMHEDPETLDIKSTVKEAAMKLSQREFHAFPVMDEDALVGIITTTDILKFITS
ncbi:MAG: CBS domain-containing protein [Vicingaceae bacterium]